ncbi:MAG: universal stress protein [Planctomycetes bacterium]|nr:universal stress protein [Planctomycetota bacterium]
MEFRTILVPTDLSENSLGAFRAAVSLARRYEGKVHAIFVLDIRADFSSLSLDFLPTIPLEEVQHASRAKAKERLDEIFRREVAAEVAGDAVVREGNPFVEIVAYAQERKADLVCLTTHGYSGLKHMLLGSVAEKVLRKAPCAVLALKVEEQDDAPRESP